MAALRIVKAYTDNQPPTLKKNRRGRVEPKPNKAQDPSRVKTPFVCRPSHSYNNGSVYESVYAVKGKLRPRSTPGVKRTNILYRTPDVSKITKNYEGFKHQLNSLETEEYVYKQKAKLKFLRTGKNTTGQQCHGDCDSTLITNNLCMFFSHHIAKELNSLMDTQLYESANNLMKVIGHDIQSMVCEDKPSVLTSKVTFIVASWVGNIFNLAEKRRFISEASSVENEETEILNILDEEPETVVSACQLENEPESKNSYERILEDQKGINLITSILTDFMINKSDISQ